METRSGKAGRYITEKIMDINKKKKRPLGPLPEEHNEM